VVYRKPDVDAYSYVSNEARPIVHAFSWSEFVFISEALHFFAGVDDFLKE
jgi:hypothetical protein